MIVLLLFSIVALLLTYFETKGIFKNGFKWGIIIVTIIAAIHYDYGSDYWEYYASYQDCINNNYSIYDLIFGEISYKGENGWVFLMYLLKPLGITGFFVFVALISVFQGIVVYKLVKTYVPKEWMVFALFFYLFNLSLFVGSLSGMRQHLSMVVVACSVPLILKKRIIPSILIVLIASTIHVSSLVFLPFVFWGYLPLKKTRYLSFILLVIYIVLLISSSLTGTIVNNFLTVEDFEHYDTYLDVENKFTYGFGYFISQLMPYIITLDYLFNNYKDETKKRLVSLVAAGMTLLPLMASVHLGTRLLYYFEFIAIVSIPIVYSSIKNKVIRVSLTLVYSSYLVYAYIAYFYSDQRYLSTFIYHSLFDLL